MNNKNDNTVENKALETSVNEAPKKEKKVKKPKRIKNQALFKRGGYAIAITAAVLAGIVGLNVLLGVLAERIPLEYDMTTAKSNSIQKENIEYIKSVDKEVVVTVCAKKSEYYSTIGGYAQEVYGLISGNASYFDQTITLLNKYDNYNKNIKIRYVDIHDTEFSEISVKYPQEQIGYGDIIVTCKTGDTERYKVVGFQDIYMLEADETYAAYGMSGYALAGNNIETALTSAIAYVTNNVDKKVAFITGHSKEDYTANYRQLLKNNNYKVDVLSDAIVTQLSDEYDAIFIAAPNTDFLDAEIDVLSKFLDNDGKYGKGLVYFADAASPYLPKLSMFLEEWGIEVQEGIVFETDNRVYLPNTPTAFYSLAASDNEILNGMGLCITGYNVPISQAFESHNAIETTVLFTTTQSAVAAPVGTSNDWKDADKYTKEAFATVIQAKRFNYNENNDPIQNHVFAFSSIEFIHGQYGENAELSNKNIAFKVAERAVGADVSGQMFDTKTLESETFEVDVTDAASQAMIIIFMVILPLAIIGLGIFVYIRRKNS